MTQSLYSGIIYRISEYLETKDKISYLKTDREAKICFDLPICKKLLTVIRIQRWWRKLMIPCINGDKLSYKISIDYLINNWKRFTNRKIQFLQSAKKYTEDGKIRPGGAPMIYTLTCDSSLAPNCVNVRLPGNINMYSLLTNRICKYKEIRYETAPVHYKTSMLNKQTLRVIVRDVSDPNMTTLF